MLILAALFSSPLFFTHWWRLRWFRVTWWVCLGFAALVIVFPFRGLPINNHAVAPKAAPNVTADEMLAQADADIAAEKKRDLALSACKVMALNDSNLNGDANATENYFNACMASRGYKFSYADLCISTPTKRYALANNPAYNYVTGVLDLGENGIEECYVEDN